MGMWCKKKTMIGWKKYTEYEVEGARPKKTRTDIQEKDCQARKLNREDAMGS